MADCTNAAIRNVYRLNKCDYKPDNKRLYGSHLVDNSWGKVYKGWPTSIELHMGYKRDQLRLDNVERGNRAMGATRLTTTRSPTRNGSTFAGTSASPSREDLRSSPNGRMLPGSPTSQSARDFQLPSPIRIRVP